MRYRTRFIALTLGLAVVTTACGADWITAPSYYTHDPTTGQRVTQYSPIGPFYTYARADYLRSGYRQTRSSIQVGNSADNMHIVEEWGRAIRPYGEWRFPYRPYSAPYSMWGAPYAGLGYPSYFPPYAVPYGDPGYGDSGRGGPGYGAHGGRGQVQRPYDRQQPPPHYDGSYPRYRSRPRANVPGHRRGPHPERRPVPAPHPGPRSGASPPPFHGPTSGGTGGGSA